jgi:tRNA1(Val) A37 N6-methylase TrmN6
MQFLAKPLGYRRFLDIGTGSGLIGLAVHALVRGIPRIAAWPIG